MVLLLVLMVQQHPVEVSETQVLEWLTGLGSEDIACRDSASRNLETLGEHVHPSLQMAMNSPDAEVRARCRALLRGVDFEKGARQLSGIGVTDPPLGTDRDLAIAYEQVAREGSSIALAKEDARWFPYILEGLLNDDPKVIKSSLRALHLIIRRRKLVGVESPLCSGLDLGLFESAGARAKEYSCWRTWLREPANENLLVRWGSRKPKAAEEEWEELLRDAAESRPRIHWPKVDCLIDLIRTFGEEAYPFLIFYLDYEDIRIGRTALDLLEALTTPVGKVLTEANKNDIRAEWLAWLKSQ